MTTEGQSGLPDLLTGMLRGHYLSVTKCQNSNWLASGKFNLTRYLAAKQTASPNLLDFSCFVLYLYNNQRLQFYAGTLRKS